jgi:single-stranded DNA-specific DHH superfamily exonuclease
MCYFRLAPARCAGSHFKKSRKLISKFGGHAGAAGLSIREESFAEFAEQFKATVAPFLFADDPMAKTVLCIYRLAVNEYLGLENIQLIGTLHKRVGIEQGAVPFDLVAPHTRCTVD